MKGTGRCPNKLCKETLFTSPQTDWAVYLQFRNVAIYNTYR